MKRIFNFLMLITLLALTSGCIINNNCKINGNVSFVYLFNRYMQRIEKYNLNTCYTEGRLYDDLNMVQYEFPYRNVKTNSYNYRLFSSGHNVYNKFEVIKLTENKIQRLFKNKNKDEGLFPIDVYDDKIFFQSILYKNQKPYKWGIVFFDADFKHREDINLTDIVEKAVVLNNKIYYLTYVPQLKNYELYYINLNNLKKIKCELKSEVKNIFKYKNILLVCDENYIYGVGNFKIPYKVNSYFDDRSQTLIQIFPENGILKCKITDLINNKQLAVINNPIDFKYVNNNIINIFCDGEIHNVDIGKLREVDSNE